MLKIEKGVPIWPALRGRPRGRTKYPFDSMAVGDSFFSEGATRNYMARSCAEARLRLGWQFSMRKTDGGYRVWRVA